MEHLFLNSREHNYLRSNIQSLEADYNVQIELPEVDDIVIRSSSDVIFARMQGEESNIERVKSIMRERCAEVPVITLSDSDTPVLSESQNKVRRKKTRKRSRFDSPHPTPAVQASCSTATSSAAEPPKFFSTGPAIIFMPDSTASCSATNSNNCGNAFKPQMDASRINSCPPAGEFISLCSKKRIVKKVGNHRRALKCENHVNRFKRKAPPELDDSVVVLHDDTEFVNAANNSIVANDSTGANDSIVLLEEKKPDVALVVPRPLPRKLRPIVIDGSNVAREHGKATSTYSSRGIQLSIEFFLLRGHSEVVAFVPNFRRHRTLGAFPTTDTHILEELNQCQRVVFTPSRTLNGQRIACYDDRFIVELAATNNGVILSNDNYRDLVGESESFKKTIEERLLMFCFVGDLLMTPKDPLGRHGPSLDDFLSFPPDS